MSPSNFENLTYYSGLNELFKEGVVSDRKTLHDCPGSVMHTLRSTCAILKTSATLANDEFKAVTDVSKKKSTTIQLRTNKVILGGILKVVQKKPEITLIKNYSLKNQISIDSLEEKIALKELGFRESSNKVIASEENPAKQLMYRNGIVRKALKVYDKMFKKKTRRDVEADWGNNFPQFRLSQNPDVVRYFRYAQRIQKDIEHHLEKTSIKAGKHRKKIEIAEKHLKLEQKKENKIFLGLVSNKRTLESGSDSNLV